MKEAHCFVKENTLVGFWSECLSDDVMKYEEKLIEELNPVCNTKGKKKNKVIKNKKKKEENTAKEEQTIIKGKRAMIYRFTSIKREFEDELEERWVFDKVNLRRRPRKINYID